MSWSSTVVHTYTTYNCPPLLLLLLPFQLKLVPQTATMSGSGAGDDRRVSVPACFMPRLGLGCWQSSTGEVGRAVEWALETGVRLIDSAYAYGNEKEIGRALAKCIDKGAWHRGWGGGRQDVAM